MRRSRPLLLSLAIAAVAVGLGVASPTDAEAQARVDVDFLANRLKTADDYKVRTKAALELGAVVQDDAPKAVQPLCEAIHDPSEVVRQAVALALKRLARPAGLPCLRQRHGMEPNETVKLQLTRAIEAIEANGSSADPAPPAGAPEPKQNPSAKYYVAYSFTNNMGRSPTEADALVLTPMRTKFDAAGTIQIAPQKETPEAARGVLSKRKMKGYYLAVAVDPPAYVDEGGGMSLKVKVKVAVFTYPGKDLRGSFDKGLSQNVGKRDKVAEDRLISMAAGLAFEQFAQAAPQFQ